MNRENLGCVQVPLWKHSDVRVISRKAIRDFAKNHPDALQPLLRWADATEKADWRNPADMRAMFNSADFVRELTVFDIGGNKYRLIAFVHYRRRFVYIKRILTHREYDKGAWKQ